MGTSQLSGSPTLNTSQICEGIPTSTLEAFPFCEGIAPHPVFPSCLMGDYYQGTPRSKVENDSPV